MIKVFIYTLTNLGNNQIFYIGQTTDLAKRKGAHNFNFNKKGIKFSIDVIEEVMIKDDFYFEVNSLIIENYWIGQFRTWGFDLINKSIGRNRLPDGEKKVQLNCGYCSPKNREAILLAIIPIIQKMDRL